MRLNFNDLDQNFEIIERNNLANIKGGTSGDPYEYAVDPNGNLYRRIIGMEDWESVTTLPELVITYRSDQPNWGSYIAVENPFNGGGDGGTGGTGTGTGTGTGQGNGSTGGLDTVTFGFIGITIPEQLRQVAISYLEDFMASPAFKIGGSLQSAYEAYDVVANAQGMSNTEFTYRLSVIAAGAVNAWAGLGLVSFVSFCEVMANAYSQGETFTAQWLYDMINPTDPNAFFSPIPQDVRDEWAVAAGGGN